MEPAIVTCVWRLHYTDAGLWEPHCTGLSFKFKIDILEPEPTTPLGLTPSTPSDVLQYRAKNVPIVNTTSHNDPWNHSLSRYSASVGTLQNKKNLNLSTLVIKGDEVFSKDEWS